MSWELESLATTVPKIILVFAISTALAAILGLVFGLRASLKCYAPFKTRISAGISEFSKGFSISCLVCFIGSLVGQLGGISRTGVVGDMLPALMTLMGGYAAYFFGDEKPRNSKVARNSICFVLSFLIMYNLASVWRQDVEAYEFCKAVYSDAEFAKDETREQRDKIWGVYCSDVFKRWTDLES